MIKQVITFNLKGDVSVEEFFAVFEQQIPKLYEQGCTAVEYWRKSVGPDFYGGYSIEATFEKEEAAYAVADIWYSEPFRSSTVGIQMLVLGFLTPPIPGQRTLQCYLPNNPEPSAIPKSRAVQCRNDPQNHTFNRRHWMQFCPICSPSTPLDPIP